MNPSDESIGGGGFSLDQLRVFATIITEGSFSAAARKLGRGQPAITYLVRKLEEWIGAPLFDRSTYRATLTEAGRALLPRAQRVLEAADAFRLQATEMTRGLEPELAIVVDAMFPMAVLFAALQDFERTFPTVQTRLFVETMGSTLQTVLRGDADIGLVVAFPFAGRSEELDSHRLGAIDLVKVAAPSHPLSGLGQAGRPLAEEDFGAHLQLVLTDRTERTRGHDFGVFSARTWRLADLGAKHSMLLAGLGWGSMPRHMVAADLDNRRLVELTVAGDRDRPRLDTAIVHRRNRRLGPAGCWFLARARDA